MFKDILLDLMKERGLKMCDLAFEAKIPATTISGWLNAGRLPDYHALIKLSQFFEVSADVLLGLKEYWFSLILYESIFAILHKNRLF